jgi:succinate-semialdehyde dehydrogenase / glutarate-semialdehyde dehydrogenase
MELSMFDTAHALAFQRQANLIGGSWEPADDGGKVPVTNPATGETIGHVPRAGASETRRAIEAAEKAFPAWAAKTAAERSNILNKMAEIIRSNADALAALLTLEQGKPLAESKGEVMIGAAYVQWFAEEARRVYGDIIPSPWPDRRILVTKEPVGVVAAITPWNFPFSMLARKFGAALAAGCTVVGKPAGLTPYTGLVWGVLGEMAGVPAGVINLVTGGASAIGTEMTSNPAVRKITFTGSTSVGKHLAEAAARMMKRFTMELGGNAPFLVFADCDLDRAVEGAIAAKYRNSGQTCVCTNRFYVEESIYDTFAAKLAQKVKGLKVGNGFEPGVQQGPLIDNAAMDKVGAHVADAIEKGGKLLAGGGPHELGGTFYQPTVIANCHQDMLVAKEETFGPLSALIPFQEEDAAVAMANDTEFGLAAYMYTRDLARTFRVSSALRYGMVGINDGIITTEVAPFGGVKESGVGREGSKYGIEDYLDIKYLSVGGL